MVSWDAGFQFCPFQLFSSLSLLSSVCWQQPCSPPPPRFPVVPPPLGTRCLPDSTPRLGLERQTTHPIAEWKQRVGMMGHRHP